MIQTLGDAPTVCRRLPIELAQRQVAKIGLRALGDLVRFADELINTIVIESVSETELISAPAPRARGLCKGARTGCPRS